MLDIRLIRENPDAFRERVKTRGGDAHTLFDALLECDEIRRRGETEKQSLQGDRNRMSKEIGARKKAGEDTTDVEAQVREIGARIKEIGEEVDAADEKQRALLLDIPNTPHPACPVGHDETANPVIREWGAKPDFDFEPEDHVAIAQRLGLLDFEGAVKTAGSGFPGFTGPGVLALLHRYNADSRDGGRAQRMEVLNAEEGVWGCTAVGYCSEVCPKGVDPANAVNQNKVNSAKNYFLNLLLPQSPSKGAPR